MVAPRARAACVVLDDRGAVLVIRRQKDGRHYCVLPGGGVEDGESGRDAALRELREETGLSGWIVRDLWTIRHPDRVAHYYLAGVASGVPELGGPERERQSPADQHRPEWIRLSHVARADLQPVELRRLLADLDRPRTLPAG